MEGYYGRLCALLALSIMLELPLREAGYGTLLFGLLIISVSYAGRHGASAKNLPGPGRGVPGGQLLDPEAERSAEGDRNLRTARQGTCQAAPPRVIRGQITTGLPN